MQPTLNTLYFSPKKSRAESIGSTVHRTSHISTMTKILLSTMIKMLQPRTRPKAAATVRGSRATRSILPIDLRRMEAARCRNCMIESKPG
jgi:hypothetical protein